MSTRQKRYRPLKKCYNSFGFVLENIHNFGERTGIMQNLLSELTELLSKDERLVSEGSLLKNKVIELALAVDSGLIKLLLKNKSIKKHFFTDVDDVLVFDKIAFQKFVSNKEFLPDSYTAFKNKIGLVNENGDYLSESREVVLAWPYKDCVLEGGQTKEDQKRDEIFWNETLAPDEIDRLLSPKVLTNFKKYDEKGEHVLTGKEHIDFTKENLIIKGNNLLALHSLYKNFAGKVKLIYIDPPYNTGSDSFQYNDRFNHSSWLSFMKNRIQIANILLKSDGVIFVHADNNEQAYIKVMLDEIFGRDNFIETITVVNNPRGRDYGGIANMHEFIHVYSKTREYEMYPLFDADKEFPYTDNVGGFEIRELRNRNTKFNADNRRNLFYPFWLNTKKKDKNGFYEISIEEKHGWGKVVPSKSMGIQTVWRWGRDKSKENINVNICGKDNQNGGYQIIEKYREKTRLARSVWWDKEVNSERGTVHLRALFGDKVFNYPKPEELLNRIIEISTVEGDIVLDFCAGSGTTATVAHKMRRQYVSIEQMDFIESVTVKRLLKVVNGEQGGVSEKLHWKKGGSFIYSELLQLNDAFISGTKKTKTSKEILSMWKEIQDKGFVSYKVDPKQFNVNIAEFEKLSLEDQKRLLIETLDKNQLYVNYSEIDDKDYDVSETDKNLNRKFYGDA